MYYNRVIPCLILDEHKLMKTIKFKRDNYIGDPINAVRIFNKKGADEIIIIDYKASEKKRSPDFKYIKELAEQCFMPVSYGGGIRNINHMKKIFDIGIEKVIVNSMAFFNPHEVREAVRHYGAQAIVGAMDVKKDIFGRYTVRLNRGHYNTRISPKRYALYLQKIGVGEIFVNNISNDGVMNGYDLKMIKNITQNVTIPVTVCGGAGSIDDLKKVIHMENGANAVAAGSLFVYYRGRESILINYPDYEVIKKIAKEI